MKMKVFSYSVIGIVSCAILFALYTSGSPTNARLEKADEQLEQQLSYITSQIESYSYTHNGEVPDSLEEMEISFSTDVPVLRIQIDYEKKGPYSFTLCTTFARESSLSTPYAIKYQDIYNYEAHSAGYVCFDRTILDRQDNLFVEDL